MLKKIVDVMENFRQIEEFIKSVSMVSDPGELILCPTTDPSSPLTTHTPLISEDRSGLYLQAFANGVDESLDEYRKAVVDTEKRFLQNPHNPLSMVYVVIYPHNRLMEYLLKMIQGIRTQQ